MSTLERDRGPLPSDAFRGAEVLKRLAAELAAQPTVAAERAPEPAVADRTEAAPSEQPVDELETELEVSAEAVRPAIEREDYTAQADDIFATLGEGAMGSEAWREARRQVHEAYVVDEEKPQLQRLGQVVLGADPISLAEARVPVLFAELQEMRDRGQQPSPEQAERPSKMLEQMTTYHHLVRDLIVAGEGEIDRSDLTHWMSRAAHNRREWAEKTVAGIAGETVAFDFLQGLPGVKQAEFTSVHTDLHSGVDIRVTLDDGRAVRVDAKYGNARPGKPISRMPDRTVRIGIPKAAMNGFKLTSNQDVRDELARQFYEALNGAGLKSEEAHE